MAGCGEAGRGGEISIISRVLSYAEMISYYRPLIYFLEAPNCREPQVESPFKRLSLIMLLAE